MWIQFATSDGQKHATDPLTEEMLAEIPNPALALSEMLVMFKDFENLESVNVRGRQYNPANIVWVEFHEHEWLKERFPDLEWWN